MLKALEVISRSELITFDIETAYPEQPDVIMGFGVCNEFLETAYVAMHEWSGGQLVLVNNNALQVLSALRGKKLICHNAFFDIQGILKAFGVNFWEHLYIDTVCLVHTLEEDRLSYALKDLAAEIWGISEKDAQKEMYESAVKNAGKDAPLYKADLELVSKYCQKDTEMTMKIVQLYLPRLKAEGLEELFFETEVMPLYKTVTRQLNLGGIPLDLELMSRTLEEIKNELAEIEANVYNQLKDYIETTFNRWYLDKHYPVTRTGKSAQVCAALSGLSLPTTKTGKFSLTAKVLEPYKHNPFIAYLLENEPLEASNQLIVQAQLYELDGAPQTFSLTSKDHLRKLFFEHLGEKPLSYTKIGKEPQVDEDFLDSVASKHEFAALIIKMNKLNKIKSTYIEQYLKEQKDGIFYPRFTQHRTTTARYSSNLQQLPRKKDEDEVVDPSVRKYTDAIRNFFVAGEGYKLVGADAEQIEICVFADDAGDEALLGAIKNKEDIYSRVGIDIYDLHSKYSASKKADNYLKKLDPALRQKMKPVALGIRYGLEAFKLSHDLGITQEEAQIIIDRYFKNYPLLKVRMETLKMDIINKGYVESKSGRRRRLPQVKAFVAKYGKECLNALEVYSRYADTGEYKAIQALRGSIHRDINAAYNFPIQSYATSIINRSAIAIHEEFVKQNLKAYLCLNIHDELVARCPESEVDKVKQIMQYGMENTVKISVPIIAKPQVGNKYGEIK